MSTSLQSKRPIAAAGRDEPPARPSRTREPRVPTRINRTHAAFTLIELIGVLAIIAILSAILAPNMVRSIDRAAVRAEVENMRRLGEQVELYVRDNNSAFPTAAGWVNQVAAYSDLSPTDILRNRRNNNRVLLLDPALPTQRILLLSSMREGLALPAPANITTPAQFDTIWQTADGSVPLPSSWAGWSAWAGVASSGDYLVIRRINLRALFLTEMRAFTVTLNHRGGGSQASYGIVRSNGSVEGPTTITNGQTATVPDLRNGDTVNLYGPPPGRSLDYSHVISDAGATFDFSGGTWTPQ